MFVGSFCCSLVSLILHLSSFSAPFCPGIFDDYSPGVDQRNREYLVEGSSRAAAGVATSTVAVAAISGRHVATLAATSSVIGGKSLNNAVASEHAAIDGEVSAHHECTHGGVLLSQQI
jgi:hypothetical protein